MARLYTKDVEKRQKVTMRLREDRNREVLAQWGRGTLTAAQQTQLARRLHTQQKERSAAEAERLAEKYLVSPRSGGLGGAPERQPLTKKAVAACNERLFYEQAKKERRTKDRLRARYLRDLLPTRVLTSYEQDAMANRLTKMPAHAL